MKKVHVIPASIQKYSEKPLDRHCKRKVAGYARVSTDHDDQLTSYEARSIIILITSKADPIGNLLGCIQMRVSRPLTQNIEKVSNG